MPTRSAVCWLLGVLSDVPLAGHRERVAAERRQHAVDLPVADDRLRDVVVAAAVALPGQRIDEAQLEVVPAIEAGRRPVAAQLARRVPGQRRAAVVVALVHRLAERVGALEQQAVRERLVERDLQRLVVGLQPIAPRVDRDDAPERRSTDGPASPPPSTVGALMSSAGVAADALGADVGDVNRRVEQQPAFERDVPRLDVAAIDVVDFRRVFRGAAIERHAAAALVGRHDDRDALRQRARRKPNGSALRKLDGDRHRIVVVAAHRARPGVRVVGQAVAGAEARSAR